MCLRKPGLAIYYQDLILYTELDLFDFVLRIYGFIYISMLLLFLIY